MPRVAVTVDMIATGTDIKPIEIVWFMRQVRSRNFFEQMKGRGVRVIDPNDLRTVTPDAIAKTRFVLVDCVGLAEQDLADTYSLDRQPTVSLEKLLQTVATGNVHPDVVTSLASRLARLEKQLTKDERAQVERAAGSSLKSIVHGLFEALDPDGQLSEARREHRVPSQDAVPDEQMSRTRQRLLREACRPLAHSPELRQALVDLKRSKEQVIDRVSADSLTEAGISAEARNRARALVQTFEAFLREHRDEIAALQLLHGSRDGKRLTRESVRELAAQIKAPPRQWTEDRLWQAYQALEQRRVRGAPVKVLTDIVALVRFATERDPELAPMTEAGVERFKAWLAQQENAGRRFSVEQRWWLERIAEFVAANVEITNDDFELAPFAQKGGLDGLYRVFGEKLSEVIDEVTRVVAA